MDKLEFDGGWLVPAFLPVAMILTMWLGEENNNGDTTFFVTLGIGLILHYLGLHYLWDLKTLPILIGMACTAALIWLSKAVSSVGVFCGIVLAVVAVGWILYHAISLYNEIALQRKKEQLSAEADADEGIKQQVAATKGNWLRKEMVGKHLKRLYIEQRMAECGLQPNATTACSLAADWISDIVTTISSFFLCLIYLTVGCIIGLSFWGTAVYIAATKDILFFVP